MSKEPNQWFLLKSGIGTPAFNMALDEALLEAMVRIGTPVLRFYGWSEPAASFGYFQRHSEVERLTPLRPLVRRPTAGGIVPHDADWTYSVCIPVGTPWYESRALESYARMHRWIQAAFRLAGLETELAPHAVPCAGQCFAGYEQFDLLCQGRKIAGAAQRRNRSGLLIQGSVQPAGLALERERWEAAMLQVEPEGIAVKWEDLEVDEPLATRTEELKKRKYSQPGWNCRR